MTAKETVIDYIDARIAHLNQEYQRYQEFIDNPEPMPWLLPEAKWLKSNIFQQKLEFEAIKNMIESSE